jgi:Putative ER transporter, 6TM, N-terminal
MAIGCTAIVLIYPESLNHQTLTGVSKLLTTLRQLVEIQETVLSTSDPQSLAPGSKVFKQVRAMIAGAFGGIQKCALIPRVPR